MTEKHTLSIYVITCVCWAKKNPQNPKKLSRKPFLTNFDRHDDDDDDDDDDKPVYNVIKAWFKFMHQLKMLLQNRSLVILRGEIGITCIGNNITYNMIRKIFHAQQGNSWSKNKALR